MLTALLSLMREVNYVPPHQSVNFHHLSCCYQLNIVTRNQATEQREVTLLIGLGHPNAPSVAMSTSGIALYSGFVGETPLGQRPAISHLCDASIISMTRAPRRTKALGSYSSYSHSTTNSSLTGLPNSWSVSPRQQFEA